MSKIYIAEIIRIGVGTYLHGVYDDLYILHHDMRENNIERGGKFPAYRVMEFDRINTKEEDEDLIYKYYLANGKGEEVREKDIHKLVHELGLRLP